MELWRIITSFLWHLRGGGGDKVARTPWCRGRLAPHNADGDRLFRPFPGSRSAPLADCRMAFLAQEKTAARLAGQAGTDPRTTGPQLQVPDAGLEGCVRGRADSQPVYDPQFNPRRHSPAFEAIGDNFPKTLTISSSRRKTRGWVVGG